MSPILTAIALPIIAVLALVLVAWLISRYGRSAIREWWTGENRYQYQAEKLFSMAQRVAVPPAVIVRVAELFPEPERLEVLDLLSRYGVDSTPEGRQRVMLAILDLSGRQKTLVRQYVRTALVDYRDVLYAHDTQISSRSCSIVTAAQQGDGADKAR